MRKCEHCGKEYQLNNKIPNFFPKEFLEKIKYIPTCDCYDKVLEQERLTEENKIEEERKRNKIKKYKDISLIDKKFSQNKFENSNMNDKHMTFSKRYADKFIEKGTAPKGLILFGDVGTGKTHASNCIANYLMTNSKTVLVINLGLYINKLQREWAEAENDVLQKVKTCDLFIIDDLGTEKISEFVISKTFMLIDTRYRADKPMIITTNLTVDQIAKKFNKRISDRILEMCYPVQVNGKSKREINRDEFFEFMK